MYLINLLLMIAKLFLSIWALNHRVLAYWTNLSDVHVHCPAGNRWTRTRILLMRPVQSAVGETSIEGSCDPLGQNKTPSYRHWKFSSQAYAHGVDVFCSCQMYKAPAASHDRD